MRTTYTTVNGIKIAWQVFNEYQQKTIVFIHGNSSSSHAWRKQVESPVLGDYRLVTIDLPNHGKSGALNETIGFSLPAIASILVELMLEIIGQQPYVICSASLGTNIVAEMMASSLLPKGLLFAGPCIVGKDFEMDKMVQQDVDLSAVFSEGVSEETVVKYASITSASKDKKDMELFLQDYYNVKEKFRSSLYASIAAGMFNDEIEILAKKNIPVAVIFGKEEKVVNTAYLDKASFLLWNKQIYTLPGASHLVNIDAPEAFNELLASFAKDMFTTGAA